MNKVCCSLFSSFILFVLVACGGGGGSSNQAAPAPAPQAGGGSGGGAGGGSPPPANPGVTKTIKGLASGGVGIGPGVDNGVSLNVAGGGSGFSSSLGDIQRFGSVVLNDLTFNTDNAQFLVEGNIGAQSDLKQGQQILVIADASSVATDVLYRSNVKGPVVSIAVEDAELGRATLNVFGQTVITDASTIFSDATLDTIAVGNLLEISGVLDADNQIIASFVETKSSLAEYKVTGEASGLSGTTFSIEGLQVDFNTASLSNFDNNQVADGDIVEIRGLPGDFSSPANFIASEVERLPTLAIGPTAQVAVEGHINLFTSATDFEVQSQQVTTDASTVYVNGDQSSLALNVKVSIEGNVDSNDILVADRVVIQPTNAIRAEGNVEAVNVAAETLTVLGVTFQLRANTSLEDKSAASVSPFDLSDMAIGDEVEVRGYLDGATVVANRIEREDAEDRARLRGPVTAEDNANNTFAILGVTVTGQSGVTVYEDANNGVITQAEFNGLVDLGTFIKADWDPFVDTTQVVEELSIED